MDFDEEEVVEGLVEMRGRYLGPANSRYLHEIKIQSPPLLKSYSGFSGCPVFMLKYPVRALALPILCGVAIQGSVESGIVRFIERSVLIDFLAAKLTYRLPPSCLPTLENLPHS